MLIKSDLITQQMSASSILSLINIQHLSISQCSFFFIILSLFTYFFMTLNKLIAQIDHTNLKKQALDYKFANHSQYQNQQHRNTTSSQQTNTGCSFLNTTATSEVQFAQHRYHKQILQDEKQDIKIFGYSSYQILQHFKKRQNLKNRQKNLLKSKSPNIQRSDSCATQKPLHNGLKFQRRVHHKLSLNQLERAAKTKNSLPDQLRKQYFTEELFEFDERDKQNFRIECNRTAFVKNESNQQRQNGLKIMSQFCQQNLNKKYFKFVSTNSNYSTAINFKKQQGKLRRSPQQQLKDKLQKRKFNDNFQNQIKILRKKEGLKFKNLQHDQLKMIQYQGELFKTSQKYNDNLMTNSNFKNIQQQQHKQSQLVQNFNFVMAFTEDIQLIKKLCRFIQKIPIINQKDRSSKIDQLLIQEQIYKFQSRTSPKFYSIYLINCQNLSSFKLGRITISNKGFIYKEKQFTIWQMVNLLLKGKDQNFYHAIITIQNTQTLVFQSFFTKKDIRCLSGRQDQINLFSYYLKRFLAYDGTLKKLKQLQANASLIFQTELPIPIEFIQFASGLKKNVVVQCPSSSLTFQLSTLLLQSYQTVNLIKKQIYQEFDWKGISLKKGEDQFKTYNFEHFYI